MTTINNHTLQPASPDDFPAVTALLQSAGLPAEDLSPALPHFFVTKLDGRITGSTGLELYGSSALLRSMAVAPEHRNLGLASAVVNHVLAYARSLQVQRVFIITTTAADYFARKGFTVIDRSAVPEAVLHSPEFSYLCPASAVVMELQIDN
jgi:amino-acid N-acetyltransferase